MAIYSPTPDFKRRTFKLCVLTKWDFNFCVRSSPLRGIQTAEVGEKQHQVPKGQSKKEAEHYESSQNEETGGADDAGMWPCICCRAVLTRVLVAEWLAECRKFSSKTVSKVKVTEHVSALFVCFSRFPFLPRMQHRNQIFSGTVCFKSNETWHTCTLASCWHFYTREIFVILLLVFTL